MGSPVASIASSTQPTSGKGSAAPAQSTAPSSQPSGKGGSRTVSGQTAQPQFGQPNQYSNTIGGNDWSGSLIRPQSSGKGKGGASNPFQSNWSAPDTSYLYPKPQAQSEDSSFFVSGPAAD